TNMSDLNLFSPKNDLKKLLFTTKKYVYSTDSWQDTSNRTSTLILNNETSYLSLLSNIQNTNSWQSIDDYTTIPKSYGIDDEQTGYCRLDRQGHWLLLSPPPLLLQKDTSQVVTYYDNRRLSRDSNIQQIEHIFHDSCESLTVSLDLHIPTD
ncbi:unnamed protein product, partial [Adineta steineri]